MAGMEENKHNRLKQIVESFDMHQVSQMISQIEDGLNNINSGTRQQTASGVEDGSSNLEISSSQFGRILIEYLWSNHGGKYISKACFLDRLEQETLKVVSDILENQNNMIWVAGGLSVVAYIMEELKKSSNSGIEYRRSLLYMLGLLKYMNQQLGWELPTQKRTDIVQFIVFGSLLFSIQMKYKNLYWCGSYLKVTDTEYYESRLGSAYKDLAFGNIMKYLPTSQHQSQTPRGNEELVTQVLHVDNEDKSMRAVVVEGPDGIGKTTVANAAFNRLNLRRYRVSRLQVDHDVSGIDMTILQQQILRDLFCEKIDLKSCAEGQAHLSNAFREAAYRPVFIFIDNAHFDLGKLLPAEEKWFPIQSRILITTTDHSKCSMPAYIEQHHYKMKPLAEAEAKNLIFQNALGRAKLKDVYSFVEVCRGVPLALRMLSSYISRKGVQISANDSLSTNSSSTEAFDICSRVIDFIYNSLQNPYYQEAFLDIAIFFNNWERRTVTYIFQDIQLNVLEEAGLIAINPLGILSIHGVVRKWARKVSGEERITNVKSFRDVLQEKEKLRNLKGIWLSDNASELQLEAAALDVMHTSLRVLYLGKSTKVNGECISNFQNLRFFYLYNKCCLPISFGNITQVAFFHGSLRKHSDLDQVSGIANLTTSVRELKLTTSLRVLDLSDSQNMENLPQGIGFFYSLEELDLSNSDKLRELPNWLCQLKSLYRLSLRGCSEVSALPETLGSLSCLAELDCADCRKLEALPESFGDLISLFRLWLSGYSKLISLRERFGNISSLEYLDLSFCTQLTNLPSSFKELGSLSLLRLNGCSELRSLSEDFPRMSNLEELDLTGCDKLASLPRNFGHYKYLRMLKLCCAGLISFPESLGFMISLQFLTLTDCRNFTRLHSGIWRLQSLSSLHMFGCSKLTGLPFGFHELSVLDEIELEDCRKLMSIPDEQPPSLRVLKLRGCSELYGLPDSIGKLPLEEMVLTDCRSLASLPESLSQIKSLRHLRLRGASKLTCFPDNLSSCIETLDLGGCSSLKSLPQGIWLYSSLKLLFVDGCSMLSGLPEDFGLLKSLTYLSIADCKELESFPQSLQNMSNLLAVDASRCPKLQGETMDKMAQLPRLYVVDVSESPLLIEQWEKRGQLHNQLVLRSEMDGDQAMLYEDMIISCLFPKSREDATSSDTTISPLFQLKSKLRQLVIEFQRYGESMSRLSQQRIEFHQLVIGLQRYAELLAMPTEMIILRQCQQRREIHQLLAELQTFEEDMSRETTTSHPSQQRSEFHPLVLGFQSCEEAIYGDTVITDVYQQRRQLHQLVVELQRFEEDMYEETTISYLYRTSGKGTVRFAFVVTCCSECQRLQVVMKEVDMLLKEGFQRTESNETEMYSEMKSRNLLCFALLRLLKTRRPEAFAALEIRHTLIVTVDVSTDEESPSQHKIRNVAVLPDVEDLQAFTDIRGGLRRFYPSLLDKLQTSCRQAQ